MSNPLYMPFYIGDYLADTAHLSTVEHGAYLLLIMTYWQTKKPLPNDDKKLARICRLSIKKFQNVKQNVIEFFSVTDSEWRHKRIDKEIEKINAKSEQARLAAQSGVQKRSQKQPANAQRTPSERSADAEPIIGIGKDNNIISPPVSPPSGGKPKKLKRERTQIAADFKPNDDHQVLATELGLNLDLEFQQFFDYWKSRGNPMADWNAALRNWLRNARKFNSTRGKNHDNTSKTRTETDKRGIGANFYDTCRRYAEADIADREAVARQAEQRNDHQS